MKKYIFNVQDGNEQLYQKRLSNYCWSMLVKWRNIFPKKKKALTGIEPVVFRLIVERLT